MKSMVLYHTNYNSTKNYAEVITKHFKIDDIFNINDFDQATIGNYDILFLGSNVRSMKIGKPVQELLEKIKREEIKIKVFLFIVAGTPEPLGRNIAKDLKQKYEVIRKSTCFGGALAFAELTPQDQQMTKMGYDMLKRELKDYNYFKEENVIAFCHEVENFLK